MISQLLKNARLTVAGFTRDRNWLELWEMRFLPKILPLLLGLGLGVSLALFITNEVWPLVVGVLLLVPAAVLFNTYPFAALLIWISAMPFLQTTSTSTYRTIYWIIHRAMPPAALSVVVLADWLKVGKRQRVRLGRAELAMVVYLVSAVVNIILLQPDTRSHLYGLYDTVFVPFCLYWYVRFTAPRARDLKWLVVIAFAIVLVESIVGLLAWLAPGVLPQEWTRYEGSRGVGTLGYPHVYTTTLVFFSFLLFQDAMNRKQGLVRSAFLCAFGLSTIGIFLSFSRGSWLGALAASVGLMAMYPKIAVRLIVLMLVLMAVLGSGILSDQMTYADERLNSEETAMGRWVLWYAGVQMVATKPFFGWGYGNYGQHAWEFQTRVFNQVAQNRHASHNSYIAIAAELGVPALLLFLFPVLWWLMLTFKVWSRIPQKGFWGQPLLIVFWMVILDHLVANFFSDMRFSTYGMGMWWITLGLIANMVDTYLQPGDMKQPKWIQHASQTV